MATEGEAEETLDEGGEMQVGGVCSKEMEGESVECYSSSILSLFIKCKGKNISIKC